MKTFNKILLLTAGLFILMSSCDKLETPYVTKLDKITPDPGDETRKVLLEEYTGHKCPNCPTGSKVAHDLKQIYGEQLIVVSVHAGFFAYPDPDGLYSTDYRTTTGTELNNYFNIQSYPKGLVNRTEYNQALVLGKDSWEPAVNELLEMPAEAKLEINHEYNSDTRKLNINVNIEFLTEMTGTFSASTYIIEDSLVSPQKNDNSNLGPVPDWEDYVHQHVLRMAVNGIWGEPVNNGQSVLPNTVYQGGCSITLDDAWVPENCHIVSFVYRNDSREVIQAEEHRVVD